MTCFVFTEIDRLYTLTKQLKEQRDEIQNQFLHWAHSRKRNRALLTELVTQLRRPALSGTAVAALVAGALAIPLTFGTSMAFGAAATAAAVGAGVVGTAMSVQETRNKTIEVIDEDRKACKDLQAKVYSLEQRITEFADFCRVHIDLVLSSELVKDEFDFLLDILRRTDREEFQAARAEVVLPTLPALLQEEVNILSMRVNTFMEQLRRFTAKRNEIATAIQHILDELRDSPNDEQIKTIIETFIKKRFKSSFDTK